MRSKLFLFCNEIWYNIASFLPSLKLFVIVWQILGQNLFISKDDELFWLHMVKAFCTSRLIDLDNIINRLCIDYKGIELIKILFSNKICSRSGCYKKYCEINNCETDCLYHTGKLSSNGCLTCCRGQGFKSVGCNTSFHDGLMYRMVHLKRIENCKSSNSKLPVIGAQLKPIHTNNSRTDLSLPLIRPPKGDISF